MNKTLTYLVFISLFLNNSCGIAGKSCPSPHETGLDEASGVRVEVNYEGTPAASNPDESCYLTPIQVKLIAPSGKIYENKGIDSWYVKLSPGDSAEIIALFQEFETITVTETTIVYVLGDQQFYSRENGPTSTGIVEIRVVDEETTFENPLATKTIQTQKD